MITADQLLIHQFGVSDYWAYQQSDEKRIPLMGTIMAFHVGITNYHAELSSIEERRLYFTLGQDMPLEECFSSPSIIESVVKLYNKFDWV